jgi:hypothetical protein
MSGGVGEAVLGEGGEEGERGRGRVGKAIGGGDR